MKKGNYYCSNWRLKGSVSKWKVLKKGENFRNDGRAKPTSLSYSSASCLLLTTASPELIIFCNWSFRRHDAVQSICGTMRPRHRRMPVSARLDRTGLCDTVPSRTVSSFCQKSASEALHRFASQCYCSRWGSGCGSECQCSNGATCDRLTGFCDCPAGFMGKNCETGWVQVSCMHSVVFFLAKFDRLSLPGRTVGSELHSSLSLYAWRWLRFEDWRLHVCCRMDRAGVRVPWVPRSRSLRQDQQTDLISFSVSVRPVRTQLWAALWLPKRSQL